VAEACPCDGKAARYRRPRVGFTGTSDGFVEKDLGRSKGAPVIGSRSGLT